MRTLTSIFYTVQDLGSAKAIQTALLGVSPHTDTSYYVGFNVAGFEIALTPQTNDTVTGPVAYIAEANL